MARPTTRRSPRLESLEARKLLSADVTGEQQLMLELINEALIAPESAAERVEEGLTKGAITAITRDGNTVEEVISEISSAESRPPVAWDASLAEAAKKHTEHQIRLGAQTHTGPRGLETATDRVIAAGYGRPENVAENIIYGVDSSEHAMRAFLADYGPGNAKNPHRENILQSESSGQVHQEVGVAVVPVQVSVDLSTPFGSPTPKTETKLVVTQVFASKEEAAPKILGVVYDDSNRDQFYDVGEGVSNATVTITNSDTGESTSVKTWSSGGYQAEVTPGRHQIEVRVNDRIVGRRDATVGQENTKVDFRVNEAPKSSMQVPVSTPSKTTTTSALPRTVRTSVTPTPQKPLTVVTPSQPETSSTPKSTPTVSPSTPVRNVVTTSRTTTPSRPTVTPTSPPKVSTPSIDPTSVSTSKPVSASRVDLKTATREVRSVASRSDLPAESADDSSAIQLLRSSLGGNVRSWKIAEAA